MQVTVTIHEAWLARPEDLRRILAAARRLGESRRPRREVLGRRPRPPTPTTMRSRSPGRASPGPDGSRTGATTWEPGASDDEPDQDAPTDGRQLLGWAVEAGARPEGDADRLRQEEGPALEDRGMDPAAGRGGVPVRPRPAAIYDPLTEPCPPTPRAEAFAAGLGNLPAQAPQPLDRRATADVRGDLVRGGELQCGEPRQDRP